MNTATAEITLTADQEAALSAFYTFLVNPIETVFVLSGYSGCGKTTLVSTLLNRLPDFMRMVRLVNPSQEDYTVELTATTNKAAENLSHITGQSVATIHSFLGLRVQTDYRTNTTTLIPRNMDRKEGVLLFVDEASYVDSMLLEYIFRLTNKCKIVFIGDPAQLAPVKSSGTPVFAAGFTGAMLKQVVRQVEGNPIVDLSTKFRGTVNTGEFFSFKPDGHHIRHMTPDEFKLAIQQEFTRSDWRYKDSKILAWTNKRVIEYNQYVRNLAKGDPHFQVGDYAVCNSFLASGKQSLKTDQMVQITGISEELEYLGVIGKTFTVDNTIRAFMPNSLEEKNAAIKKARANDELSTVATMESQWIDLRAAYASTVNKSQGSTFDKVFIDLTDLAKCTNGNTLARMLYVAVSRARSQVCFVGDLA